MEMGNNMLAKAFGEIEAVYIDEALEDHISYGEKAYKKWARWAAMLLLVAGSLHFLAYHANAEYRQWIISFFKLSEKEQVPDSSETENNVISLYATDTIDDIFEVKYLQSEGYLDAVGDFYYYVDRDTGEEGYYSMEDGGFVSMEDIQNLENVQRQDCLDYEAIEEMTGVANVSFAKTVEEYLMLGVYTTEEEDVFSYYCYDLKEKSLKLIYENASFWEEGTSDEDTLYVAFTGKRYDLVLQGDSVYLADEITGDRYLIEGLEKEFAEKCNPISNPSGDRLLIAGEFSSEGIAQLGIIDVSKEKFFLLERSNLLPVEEYSIGWKDNDTIAIQAENEEEKGSSLYLYTLKH